MLLKLVQGALWLEDLDVSKEAIGDDVAWYVTQGKSFIVVEPEFALVQVHFCTLT